MEDSHEFNTSDLQHREQQRQQEQEEEEAHDGSMDWFTDEDGDMFGTAMANTDDHILEGSLTYNEGEDEEVLQLTEFYHRHHLCARIGKKELHLLLECQLVSLNEDRDA